MLCPAAVAGHGFCVRSQPSTFCAAFCLNLGPGPLRTDSVCTASYLSAPCPSLLPPHTIPSLHDEVRRVSPSIHAGSAACRRSRPVPTQKAARVHCSPCPHLSWCGVAYIELGHRGHVKCGSRGCCKGKEIPKVPIYSIYLRIRRPKGEHDLQQTYLLFACGHI